MTCELGVVFRVNEISRSRPIHCSVPCIFMCTFISGWYKIRRTYRVWTFSWRLDGRIFVCPVPGERRRVVDLYSATPMAAARVVERLGCPTGQCPERRPAKDPEHAGHMARPIVPPETGAKAIEPVPGGMRREWAAELFGAGVGAVNASVSVVACS